MALRTLTQEEKLSLSTNGTFVEKCKQSIRDFSAYWAINDGSGTATEEERIDWVKKRFLSIRFAINPIINEDSTTLAWFFLNAAKGKQYDLGAAPISASELVVVWDLNSSFEEFVGDYFRIKGYEINFSIS